jgi:tetratricopeptide (TPR) repeat protein
MVTLVNLYTHLTAFFVLAVEILYACLLLTHHLIAARKTSTTRWFRPTFALPLLVSLGVIAAGYAPMIPHIIRGIQGPRGLGNPDQTQGLELSVGTFLSLFGDFGAGDGIPLALYMAAFLWGLIHATRKHGRRGPLILLWTVVPFAIIFLLRPKHWFAAKYVISILPLYLMTISLGVAYLARSIALVLSHWNTLRVRRSLPVLSLGALVTIYGLMSISNLDETYGPQTGVRWREIGQLLTSNMQPEDTVISPYNLTIPTQDLMAYYGPTSEEMDFFVYGSSPEETDVSIIDSRRKMQDVLGNHRRVWIVLHRRSDTQITMYNDVFEWLSPQPYVELPVGGMSTVLYTGKGPTRLALLKEAKHFTNLTAEAHGSIGEAYCSMRMWDEALAAYIRAAEMEPGQGIWHYYLGTLYERKGQRNRALAEYQEAIRMQPEISGFHAALGDFYRRDGRADKAISEYRQAIHLYTSQNRDAEDSEYVCSWSNVIRELERSLEREEVTDNAFGLDLPTR